ncbi:MAG: hypothetical protein AAFP99_05095, partial [Pseudomonadota bacterium]
SATIVSDGKPLHVAIHSEPPESPNTACGEHGLIIEAYAPSVIKCRSSHAVVVTAQALALNGSATIHTEPDTKAGPDPPRLIVRHAISSKALRPWHAHRVWSRSARDLGPYVPRWKREDG